MNIRIGLRDHWEDPNAPAQKALKILTDLLGYSVDVEIDLPKLWSDLHKYYPDPGSFAPNLAQILQTWAECLTTRLQDEENAVWTEKLLELVTQRRAAVRARVVVSLEISTSATARAVDGPSN